MTDHDADIAGLLESVRNGDEDALASLLSAYRERLRRMVEFRLDARLRGRVSPSDVLQEAYIDAHKRLRHFRDGDDVPFFVWARTVVIQRLIEVHRQHLGAQGRDVRREVATNWDDSVEASPARMAEVMADATSPSLVVERLELVEKVRAALERLPAADGEVLALRHFEEMSNQEAAATLGLSPGAASKRYLRALEKLREILDRMDAAGGRQP